MKKGLSQNHSHFVILRNKVTKDLSFEGSRELSRKILHFIQNDAEF